MLQRVDYRFPDSDTQDRCEGKFEAILDVVCRDGAKSDVIPCGRPGAVYIAWDAEERKTAEPDVLAIINCVDSSYWDIAAKYTKR